MGIGRFAYTPLLPAMAERFGWSYAQAGDVASANFLGYLTGALLAPLLARSPAVRLWMAVSLMASVATTYLGALADAYALWLMVRFASGVASAFCLVVITAHLMQTLQRAGTHRLGNVHFAGVGAGILLCMAVVYTDADVATQWARLGAVAAVLMALAWFCLSSGPWVALDDAMADEAPSASSRRWPWRVIAGYGFFGFSYIIAATFAVAMAERLEQSASGWWSDPRIVWVIVGAATVPSVYLWQWFANRAGLSVALTVSYLVLALGSVLAGVAQTLGTLAFACVLLGGTFGGITALGLSTARAAASHRAAQTVSVMTVAFSVGQLLGPALAGRLADGAGGFLWPSVLAGVLLLVAAMLVPRNVTP